MNGGLHITWIFKGSVKVPSKTLLETSHPSTFFSGNKKQMELGNYKDLRNYYIMEFIKSLSKPPCLIWI